MWCSCHLLSNGSFSSTRLSKVTLFPMIWHSCSPCSICKPSCKPLYSSQKATIILQISWKHNRECRQPSLGGETNLETQKLWTSDLGLSILMGKRCLSNYQVVHDFTQIVWAFLKRKHYWEELGDELSHPYIKWFLHTTEWYVWSPSWFTNNVLFWV